MSWTERIRAGYFWPQPLGLWRQQVSYYEEIVFRKPYENCSRFNCVYMFSFGFANLIERRVITMNFVCVFNRTCQHFVFLAVKQYRMLLLFISCGSCLLKRLSLTQFSIVTCTTVVDRRCAQLYASSAISDFETYGLSDQRFCIRMKICVTEERPAMPAT